MKFCKYTGEIFKIPTDKQNSIQDIAYGIKHIYQLQTFRYGRLNLI